MIDVHAELQGSHQTSIGARRRERQTRKVIGSEQANVKIGLLFTLSSRAGAARRGTSQLQYEFSGDENT